jgi:hypothetical protein
VAKLKDRRSAHRVVAEAVWVYLKGGTPQLTPEVRLEVQKIREAHFAAGTIVDEVPDDHEIAEPMALAKGGVCRCRDCGQELLHGGAGTATYCTVCEEAMKQDLGPVA